MLKLFPL